MSDQGGTFQQQLVMVGIVCHRLYSTHMHTCTHTHRLVISTEKNLDPPVIVHKAYC